MSLTQRFLRATPMRLDTTAGLDAIRGKLDGANPSVASLKPGWGSYEDGDDLLGLANLTPTTGPPVSWDGDQEVVEALVARLYYYKRSPQLRRVTPAGAAAGEFHVLKAIDVVMTPIPNAADSYTVLIASWDVDEIDLALRQLKAIIAGLDDRATWTADTSVLDLLTEDFFLWLIYRALQNRSITSEMELDKLRDMASKDGMSHTVNLGEGIDGTRGELLYLVSAADVRFGPAKLVVAHDRLDLSDDMDLKITGAFSITMRSTSVHEDLDADGNPIKLDDLAKRIRAFREVADVVIPELKDAYRADSTWHGGYREQFKDDCRAETNRLTTVSTP